MNFTKAILPVLTILLLSGCSYFYGEDGLIRDTEYDYLKAKQSKGLEVPAPLVHKNLSNFTKVPAIGSQAKIAPTGTSLPIAAPSQIMAVLDNVRENKQSQDPAVFIEDKIDFVWSAVVDLLNENSITPGKVQKKDGYIDTGWVAQDERGVWLGIEGKEEVDEFRARYEIKIEPADVKTEVVLTVKRVLAQRLDDDSDQWVEVSSFWHDSAEMLNLMLASYDQKVAERNINMRSRVIAGFSVELGVDTEKNTALLAKVDKELAWEKLPKVLNALHFEIQDKDRRTMTYFFKFEREEEGFFASLFEQEKEELPLEDGDYQVVLSDVGDKVAYTFKTGEGVALDSALVAKLYPTLSKLFGDRR